MRNNKIVCMLPTYNEAKNIEPIIRGIASAVPDAHILVVDDMSPDGTASIVHEIKNKITTVNIVERSGERGRGLAGIAGFEEALRMGADVIVEMDADFSHDPQSLPQMLACLKDADVVVGSRYINNTFQDARSWIRRMISCTSHRFIRLLLGLHHVHDCTSGYRIFKRNVLEAMPWERMISKNPSIVEEIFYLCQLHGVRIKEVPIEFKKS